MPRFAKAPSDRALVVFAKAPIPGTVKTRLVPPLTPDQAVRLHAALIQDTLARVSAIPMSLYLACTPTVRDPSLATYARRYGARVIPQGPGDLGDRMYRVSRRLLARHTAVIVLGTDSPTLPLEYIERAQSALAEVDLVLGPSDDGGYYLLGQRRVHPKIFADIPWGTGDVLAATLDALDTPVTLLPPWYDVDRPSDMTRLQQELRLKPDCPKTRALLQSWVAVGRPPRFPSNAPRTA